MAGTKKKVYVTLGKMGSSEKLEFEDGDTIEHLIKAVHASVESPGDDLEIKIAGKRSSEYDKKTPLGAVANEKSEVRASAAARRGSHG